MNEPLATRLAIAYQDASPECECAGMRWYPEAKRAAREIAADAGITLAQATGIIASASLNQSWKGNITLARRLARGESVGLGQVRDECAKILSGARPTDVIGGPKRKAFWRAIMGDPDAIVIDRHAARAALTSEREAKLTLNRKGGYDLIAAAYQRAADLFEIASRDLQAVVWCETRGSAS